MLKKLIYSLLALTLSAVGYGAHAQTVTGPNLNWCGTSAELERYFAQHPGAREAQQAYYRRLESLAQTQQRSTAYVTDITVPVVVHVIHSGGTDNISDQQIASAIDQLNLDYQKLNPDTAAIIPLFRPIAAAVGFRFRLARKDPSGNCTSGITRNYRPDLTNDPQDGTIQAVGVWDQSKYLNIWVVNSIGVPSGGGIVVGYVSQPNLSSNPRDGYVIRHDYFGNQGTSNSTRALLRGPTHEIGHYFGLLHPWGNTNNPGTGDCTGTDYVADTPPTDGTFNCTLNYAPCGQIANVQNFMDYADCADMFTQGQRTLMRAVISASRQTLVSSANLVATGTNDGYRPVACAPVAAFSVAPGSSTSVCVNTPITFRDYSYNFTSTGGTVSYQWSFPGGTPATATGLNPTVSYATAGIYAVTETVTNSVGSGTSTLTNYIRVEGPTGGESAPYTESFENSGFPVLFAAPSLRNYETYGTNSTGTAVGGYRWQQQSALPAADGTGYLYVNNHLYQAGAITTLVTPNINLAVGPRSPVLSFARAFALRDAGSNDQLRVSFSADCGLNWSAPTVFTAAMLSTQGTRPLDGYVPASSTSADWQYLTIPIPSQYQSSGLFKVRFQLVNGTSRGNNFYFDHLRINTATALASTADALASHGISVYPNPLTNETAVHFNLTAATPVQITLTDLLGRTVLALPVRTYGTGQQAVALPAAGAGLRAGLYVVRIALGGDTFSSKLTVQ